MDNISLTYPVHLANQIMEENSLRGAQNEDLCLAAAYISVVLADPAGSKEQFLEAMGKIFDLIHFKTEFEAKNERR